MYTGRARLCSCKDFPVIGRSSLKFLLPLFELSPKAFRLRVSILPLLLFSPELLELPCVLKDVRNGVWPLLLLLLLAILYFESIPAMDFVTNVLENHEFFGLLLSESDSFLTLF